MPSPLSNFLAANREEVFTRARERVAARNPAGATGLERTVGLPAFFEHLRDALQTSALERVSDHADLTKSAAHHAEDIFQRGLTIAQVVHDYGDLCQVITGLAAEQSVSISATEFQTLNLCLDDAIASAVTEYDRQRQLAAAANGSERLGVLAHEIRNLLNNAIIAVASMKRGMVGIGGSTAAILDRSLMGMHVLIDRSFAEVRLDACAHTLSRVPVAQVIREVEIGASMFAEKRQISLTVTTVDDTIAVDADPQILAAAITNLLQNALKFTHHGSTVNLRVTTTPSRVLIAVEDECGGLPPGHQHSLLRPFVQRDRDRSGLGLGLSICVKAMQSMAGELHVRDIPGKGCVFTIDLPRQPSPPPTQRSAPRANGVPENGDSAAVCAEPSMSKAVASQHP